MKNKPRVVGIIQARTTSTRLPGKAMMEIEGYPVLWHVVERVRRAKLLDEVVVATTVEPVDDVIERFCIEHGFKYFRGSLKDVLDRHYQAAKKFGADAIVRITSDNPLMDPRVIDKVTEVYLESGCDYVTNNLRYTYPNGVDVEVFSFSALEKTWREARLPAEREHVTAYMRSSGLFKIQNVENEVDLSTRNLRWTIDEAADLEFVRRVYAEFWPSNKTFGMDDVLQLIERKPELTKINMGIVRNEGYYRSLATEPPLPAKSPSLAQSHELGAKAAKLIPSYPTILGTGPIQFVGGTAPVFLARGKGSHVWDADDNEYIDYSMASGAVILGHSYPRVSEEVVRQINSEAVSSQPQSLEVGVAEQLVGLIPCAEMVRFAEIDLESVSAAVKAARAYTSRDIIAWCHSERIQSWRDSIPTLLKGAQEPMKELTVSFDYNDIASLERIFADNPGKLAAVVMEPVGAVEPKDDFIKRVKKITEQEGALLVFDEGFTGLRIALGGAQQYFGVLPDLACFGRAMANGYPLSCLVGRREIMQLLDTTPFYSMTGGQAPSLAAANATIDELRKKNVAGYLWEEGAMIKDGFNVLAKRFGLDRFIKCVGLAPRTTVDFYGDNAEESLSMRNLFRQECLKRAVLFNGAHNMSFGHGPSDVDYTLRTYRSAMGALEEAIRTDSLVSRLERSSERVSRQP